jgi:hypothetical protein
MRFSQRHGHSAVKQAIQTESMDDALRNSLWNALQSVIWDSHKSSTPYSYTKHSNLYELLKLYWKDYFKSPIDEIPQNISDATKSIRGYFFECPWYEAYDFIEFSSHVLGKSRPKFIATCNEALSREMSGYRLLDDQITPITSSTELDAVEDSLTNTSGYIGANTHLRRALELLSDRVNPDYRNSIKESISAVEAVAQAITEDPSATLGEALKAISTQAPMHPALNRSLSSLYGYTSDSGGIRHALLDEPNLDFVDAKFMLVACSAFVNYLTGKSAKPLQS